MLVSIWKKYSYFCSLCKSKYDGNIHTNKHLSLHNFFQLSPPSTELNCLIPHGVLASIYANLREGKVRHFSQSFTSSIVAFSGITRSFSTLLHSILDQIFNLNWCFGKRLEQKTFFANPYTYYSARSKYLI